MTVEYEGTRYHGWQEQKNARSVSGELHRAALAAGAEVVEIGGSGRTDAGVHASAQVAHLRLRAGVDPGRLRLAMNDALPPDIHVLALEPAPDKFHARHDAIRRTYVYQIARRRTAFAKRYVWWVKRALDVRRMQEAATCLEGRHDFKLFCEAPSRQDSTLVVVEEAIVVEDGGLILVRFTASHFLWKMVRRVVGALVKVGAGELSVPEFRQLVDGRPLPGMKEGTAAWTAPPSGLFLAKVAYRGDVPEGPVIRPVVPVAAESPATPVPTAPDRPSRDAAPAGTRRRPPRR
jgi:tRNA pseudouridine38-40 synthase